MANAATFHLNSILKAATAARVTTADMDSGMNYGGSNAPGLGIASDNGQCKLSDWTVLDQAGAARDPQFSQHLGQGTLGSEITVEAGADINDTVSLTVEATGWVVNAVA